VCVCVCVCVFEKREHSLISWWHSSLFAEVRAHWISLGIRWETHVKL